MSKGMVQDRYKIDEHLYLKAIRDVQLPLKHEHTKRVLTTMNIHTGETIVHQFYINEKLYLSLVDAGYWHEITKQFCNANERVLYDANFPVDRRDILPIMVLELVITGVVI